MSTTTLRTARSNQSMEVFRLVTSIIVLLAHCRIPGFPGTLIGSIGRFAVPGFFAITGFFTYRTKASSLARRLKAMVKTTLLAFAIELLWSCVLIELDGGSSIGYLRAVFPNAQEWAEILLVNLNGIRDSLWYLLAATEVTAMLWGYVTFFGDQEVDYRPLYLTGFLLFLASLAMSIMGMTAGSPASIFLYRNALFFGLPMFTLGIFLRQHWEHILKVYKLTDKRLLLLLAASIGFALLEYYGVGVSDIMIGCIGMVLALILLMARHPHLTDIPWLTGLIGRFGTMSVAIYILHQIVIDFHDRFILPSDDPAVTWSRALLVLVITLVLSLLWERVSVLKRKLLKK